MNIFSSKKLENVKILRILLLHSTPSGLLFIQLSFWQVLLQRKHQEVPGKLQCLAREIIPNLSAGIIDHFLFH